MISVQCKACLLASTRSRASHKSLSVCRPARLAATRLRASHKPPRACAGPARPAATRTRASHKRPRASANLAKPAHTKTCKPPQNAKPARPADFRIRASPKLFERLQTLPSRHIPKLASLHRVQSLRARQIFRSGRVPNLLERVPSLRRRTYPLASGSTQCRFCKAGLRSPRPTRRASAARPASIRVETMPPRPRAKSVRGANLPTFPTRPSAKTVPQAATSSTRPPTRVPR